MLAIVALLVGASSAHAATKVVNFDGIAEGETVSNQYASQGVTVTGITAGNSKGPSAHASIRGKPKPKPKPKKKKKRKSGH